MSAYASPMRHGRIFSDPYDVDVQLARLGLTRPFLAEAGRHGDVDRRNTPPFGLDGHPEYNAVSRTLSFMHEHSGTTEGGWHRGKLHKVPVVFNHDEMIAIHPTAGTEGTGQVDGDPHNKSVKGPYSSNAAGRPPTLGPEVEERAPDFFWFFTKRAVEGLWAELFEPIISSVGVCLGYHQRILIGLIDGPTGLSRRDEGNGPTPATPLAPADIVVPRKAG